MRYFLEISYDGTNYHGWQRQPGVSTVQQTLEESLSTIFQAEVSVTGCGRTDTGVHATQFFAHFDLSQEVESSLLTHKLNTILPSDIAALNAFVVVEDTNARFAATERSYLYRIHQIKDPFQVDRSYYFKPELDLELMNKAASHMLEVDDFESFCKAKTQNMTNLCDVREAVWAQHGSNIEFRITADRFLRNMVRAVVGTLLEVGLGKMSVEEFKEVIASKDRSAAGRSVPACGLYLEKVSYPENIVAGHE